MLKGNPPPEPISFFFLRCFTTQNNMFRYNNKNNQNPSYCDRVLYMSDEGASSENLSLLWYEAVPSITISDHRPVCAGFEFLPKVPYLLKQGVQRTGAMDECVVLLQGLTFIRAPEPSRAKLTSWQQVFPTLIYTFFMMLSCIQTHVDFCI